MIFAPKIVSLPIMKLNRNLWLLSLPFVGALLLLANWYLLSDDMGGGISVYDFRNEAEKELEENTRLYRVLGLTTALPIVVSSLWIFFAFRLSRIQFQNLKVFFLYSMIIPLTITALGLVIDTIGTLIKMLGMVTLVSYPIGLGLIGLALNKGTNRSMKPLKILSWLGWAALWGLGSYLLGAVFMEKFDQPSGVLYFTNLTGWCLILCFFVLRWDKISTEKG